MGWTRSFKIKRTSAIFWLACTLCLTKAHALSLAPIQVRSYLGQVLQAEIDIVAISAQEDGSIKVQIADPLVHSGLNMDYNAAIGEGQVEVLKRPNGSRYIKLRSARPIPEPYVDLVLEVSSNATKLIRPYRLLLDPPSAPETVAAVPDLAERATNSTAPNEQPAVAKESVDPLPNGVPAVKPAASKANRSAREAEKPASEESLVDIRPGDTVARIAARYKPEDASLDQMLVALLQSNPQAFQSGNVNWMQAGARLTLPAPETVFSVDAQVARTSISAQAQAFSSLQRAAKKHLYGAKGNEYVQGANRALSDNGEGAPPGKTIDALKLSKNTVQSRKELEKLEQISAQKNGENDLMRAAELAKNIQDLKSLADATQSLGSGPNAQGPLPRSGASNALPTAADRATAPASPASQSASSAPKAAVQIATAPSAAQDADPIELVVEAIQEYQLPLLGGAAILASTLAAIALRRRRKVASIKEIRPAPNSAQDPWTANSAGKDTAYNGEQVDTNLVQTSASTEGSVFAADLDPVAEADVYLAYGKDEPAEEILREGLVHDPKRVAIHMKLAEIYAARQDVENFEICAAQVEALSGLESADWGQIKALGARLEPDNPGYQGASGNTTVASTTSASLDFDDSIFPSVGGGLQETALRAGPKAASGAETALNADSVLSFAPGGDKASKQPVAPDSISFDLDGLSLDLSQEPSPQTQSNTEQLGTSMELAKQFIEIGEIQSARSMLGDVIAKGSDEQRRQAQALLATLK